MPTDGGLRGKERASSNSTAALVRAASFRRDRTPLFARRKWAHKPRRRQLRDIITVLLEVLVFLVSTLILPVLVNKSTERGRFDWLHSHLRRIWTGLFAFFSVYFLLKPDVKETMMKLHQRTSPSWLGYLVCALIGAALLCGYWWLTGRLIPPTPAERVRAILATATKAQPLRAPAQTAVSHRVASPAPAPPVLVDWRKLLLQGDTVTVEVKQELPESVRRALFIAGQRYQLHFSATSQEWMSTGPIAHPTEGLVSHHTNNAGPHVEPGLSKEWSHTSVASDSYSPSENKFVLMGVTLTFDANGGVYFGPDRVGRLLLTPPAKGQRKK
jgi:hypothetical protein